MFQLSGEEFNILKSQFVISSWGGVRKLPYAFTEQGVAMLSSVLNSERAIQVNIQRMRTFTKLREIVLTNTELRHAIEKLERKVKDHDTETHVIFNTINQLLAPPKAPKRKIGFQPIQNNKRDIF